MYRWGGKIGVLQEGRRSAVSLPPTGADLRSSSQLSPLSGYITFFHTIGTQAGSYKFAEGNCMVPSSVLSAFVSFLWSNPRLSGPALHTFFFLSYRVLFSSPGRGIVLLQHIFNYHWFWVTCEGRRKIQLFRDLGPFGRGRLKLSHHIHLPPGCSHKSTHLRRIIHGHEYLGQIDQA